MTEPPAPFLLAVDRDLGLTVVAFLEVEVAAVEDDVGVMIDDVWGSDGEVVVERASDRRDRLVNAVLPRAPLRWEVFEGRHLRQMLVGASPFVF